MLPVGTGRDGAHSVGVAASGRARNVPRQSSGGFPNTCSSTHHIASRLASKESEQLCKRRAKDTDSSLEMADVLGSLGYTQDLPDDLSELDDFQLLSNVRASSQHRMLRFSCDSSRLL